MKVIIPLFLFGFLLAIIPSVNAQLGKNKDKESKTESKEGKDEMKDEKLERPEVSGVASVDNFVNTSFDHHEKVEKLHENLEDVEHGIAAIQGKGDAEQTKALIAKLMGIQQDAQQETSAVTELSSKASGVQAEAKSAGMKALKAGKNINAAIKANNSTLKHLKDMQATILEEMAKLKG